MLEQKVQKNEISYKSIQVISTIKIEMIMKNEKKNYHEIEEKELIEQLK